MEALKIRAKRIIRQWTEAMTSAENQDSIAGMIQLAYQLQLITPEEEESLIAKLLEKVSEYR